jgi:hypothetical protein
MNRAIPRRGPPKINRIVANARPPQRTIANSRVLQQEIIRCPKTVQQIAPFARSRCKLIGQPKRGQKSKIFFMIARPY